MEFNGLTMWFLCVLSLYLACCVHCEFRMTLAHHNDIHSFIVPSVEGRSCTPEQYHRCFGGVARLATAVRRLENEENFLHLNAGDMYQGTLWYTILKWRPLLVFTNLLHMHAMALGNHEFDDGIAGLIPYIQGLKVPILAANVDLTYEPEVAKYVKPSLVLVYNNTKVGIIGYITPDTKELAFPGKIKFLNEEKFVAKEARRLKNEGVNIIIALGHSGYNRDKEIAEAVPLVDVVVGGHTHSFLYSGSDPVPDIPEGPYPTVITQSTGRKVLVVQAKSYTKYLGKLQITFSDDGEVQSWSGQPILLDNSIPEDPEFLKEVHRWIPQLQGNYSTVIGETYVRLDGFGDKCRIAECNAGNLFTEAILKKVARPSQSGGWSRVTAAAFNSGGLRATLDSGSITAGDMLAVHPFNNGIAVVSMNGDTLKKMAEDSVKLLNFTTNYLSGAFLQVAGMRIKYDMCEPVGSRVVDLEILCSECKVPAFVKVNSQQNYTLAISDYIVKGGDGYTFSEEANFIEETGLHCVDVVKDYIKQQTPLITGVDGRIELVRDGTDCTQKVMLC